MRIKVEQLNNALQKSLKPIYLISGDEPLQMMEAEDTVRKLARQNGFTEREVFQVERGFDWGLLIQSANSMSLFAEKKIIELRFNSAKPGDAGSKTLCEYCQTLNQDNILIISMPKLDGNAQRSKWFKAIDQVGALVQIWPIEAERLPQWVSQRLQSRRLTANQDAIRLLCEKVEGNLLAAAQEIEKLAINTPANVTVDDILETVADDAKYDVFKLVDAAVLGKQKRAARILRGLKASGEEPVVILWALTREIRSLINMASEKDQGIPLGQVLSKYRVWDKRVPIVKNGLSRFSSKQWSGILRRAIRVDLVIKGVEVGNPWDELLDLSFSMAGNK